MLKDEDFVRLSQAALAVDTAEAQKATAGGHEKLVHARAELADLSKLMLKWRGDSNSRFAARHEEFAASYQASPDLRTAVMVALALGRPILLTGEPGTGKTLAAYWIAKLFADGSVLRFQVKSESRAKDLLYVFDAASWFRESQIKGVKAEKRNFVKSRVLGQAFGMDGNPTGLSVVLIDEIDKAPRDFPNDLLHEIDQMSFEVDEIEEIHGKKVSCPPDLRPIVVITSNSERQLPPPFLRRCVVHHIVLDEETVGKILLARLAGWGVNAGAVDFIAAASSFWTRLSTTAEMEKKITIDEYWRWLALELEFGGTGIAALTETISMRRKGGFKFVGSFLSAKAMDATFDGRK